MLLPNFAEIKIPFQDRAETIGILGENDEFLRVLNDSFACRIVGRGTDLLKLCFYCIDKVQSLQCMKLDIV